MTDSTRNDWGLQGRVALVTGGSRGIGLAVAQAYAREGMHVIIAARGEQSLKAAQAEIASWGGMVTGIPADISRRGDVLRLAKQANSLGGVIDVLVNNASLLGPRLPILDYPEQAWNDVMMTNLTGAFLLTRTILRGMMERDQGSIINVSSGVGRVGKANWGAYAVSKFGIEGLTQVLAAEMEGTGIRVNAVNPGPTRTEMRAAAYPNEVPETLPEPREIVAVFLYLASRESRQVNGKSLEARDWMERR